MCEVRLLYVRYYEHLFITLAFVDVSCSCLVVMYCRHMPSHHFFALASYACVQRCDVLHRLTDWCLLFRWASSNPLMAGSWYPWMLPMSLMKPREIRSV
jgi:hypothetical protein